MPARQPASTGRITFDESNLAAVLAAAPARGLVLLAGGPAGEREVIAQRLANERGQKLLRVDLAELTGRYIGETEKNLRKLFAAARSEEAVLFFDEADALFGRRGAVRDAHDRYANAAAAYLLNAARRHGGLVLAATGAPAGRYDDLEHAAALLVEIRPPRPQPQPPRPPVPEPRPGPSARPLSALHFEVLVDGEDVGACHLSGIASVTGPAAAPGEAGADGLEPLVLRRAVTASRLLFDWRQNIVAGKADRRLVELRHLPAPNADPVHVWQFIDCWPARWSGPLFDALAGAVALEEVELRYARLVWL